MTLSRSFACTLVVVLCAVAGPALAQHKEIPREIGGFRLNSYIDEYDLTAYSNYIKEVIVSNVPGFRKGMIAYGTCADPGKILRIKMKYEQSDRKFFERLLKQYKRRFGKPAEFDGDAFGTVLAWKWRFKDKDGNNITLVLQHNSKSPDRSMGNVVKLSLPDRIEAEHECFTRLCKQRGKTPPPRPVEGGDLRDLIPCD